LGTITKKFDASIISACARLLNGLLARRIVRCEDPFSKTQLIRQSLNDGLGHIIFRRRIISRRIIATIIRVSIAGG